MVRLRSLLLLFLTPLAVGALLVAANISEYLHGRDLVKQLSLSQSRAVAEEMQIRLENLFLERANDLALLGASWQVTREENRAEHFLAEATNLIEREPSYHVINFVDAESVIRISAPEGKQPELLGLDLSALPGRGDLHRRVRESLTAMASPPMTLTDGLQGVVIWYPVLDEAGGRKELMGMVAGAFHVGDLVERSLPQGAGEGFLLRISYAGKDILVQGVDGETFAEGGVLCTVKVENLLGESLEIMVAPSSQNDIASLHSDVAKRLVANLLVSLLVTTLLLLLFLAMHRVRSGQRNLEESEQRYRTLFESAGDAIYLTDMQGRILAANSLACESLGYSHEELMALQVRDVESPEQAENFKGRLQAISDKGRAWFETAHQRKDGSAFPVEVVAQLVEHRGQPAILGVVRDMTRRKEWEQALKESEEKYRTVFQSSSDGILLLKNNVVIECNPAARRILGMSREDILGKSLTDFTPAAGDDDQELKAQFKAMLAQVLRGERPTFPWSIRRPDGAVVDMELTLDAVDMGGERVLVCSGRDVTGQRASENALRTAKEGAEAANRSKSEFLANMSHEIRTPLSGLLGMVQLVISSTLTPDQREYLDMAMDSGNNLLRILSDILDLSRIEAGKMEILDEEFHLDKSLEPILAIFGDQARQKGIQLRYEVAPDTPRFLVGDESRLRQLLFNLVGNAVKFTRQGEVRLEVSAIRSPHPDKVRLLFVISDTGIGIPDTKIQAIFNPFTQGDSTYAKQFHGAGLGLSLVRRIVTLMGGGLSLDSEEGRGTTFLMTLDFTPVKEELMREERPEAAAEDVAPGNPLRILVAEDEKVNRLAAVRLLQGMGHQAESVENGLEVLEALKREAYDCVLMDVQMPEMDGVEATRRIRAGEAGRPDIPIIALTAYAMRGDRETFLAAGMDAYLAKPLQMEDLERILASVPRPA